MKKHPGEVALPITTTIPSTTEECADLTKEEHDKIMEALKEELCEQELGSKVLKQLYR